MSGRENLCESAEITGETVQGGYTKYISASEEFVTPVTDSFDLEHAVPLFCPGIAAYKAVKASEHVGDKTVVIFGIGGVGHLAIQIEVLWSHGGYTAIRSTKKGGIVVLGVRGNVSNFPTFEEKTVKGRVILVLEKTWRIYSIWQVSKDYKLS